MDVPNEHQAIEDWPETITVFVVGRSRTTSNRKREIKSQWKVDSLRSILCFTLFFAIVDFHVKSTASCGPWCLVDNYDRRVFFESFRILRLDIWWQVSATLVTVSWNELQEAGLAWS